MRNIALKLMYNGTAYHGWQVQKTVSSVCETMERASQRSAAGTSSSSAAAARTRACTPSATSPIFHTESRIPVERLPFAINTHTPEDIVVREALEVAEDFNAILSCQKKEYTYRIYNSRIKNPFYVNRAYFYPKHLDEEVMDRAARAFEARTISAPSALSARRRRPPCAPCTTAACRARVIFWNSRSARTGSCITWYGRSPARCSTPPRGSSRQRTSPRSCLRRPLARRPHGAAGRTVHDETLV